MYGKLSVLALLFWIGIAFVPGNRGKSWRSDSPGDPSLDRILQLYHEADRLFHLTHSTPATDSTAFEHFDRVIYDLKGLPTFTGKDTLFFQSWLKKGILLDSRYDYTGAKGAYQTAMRYHPQIDSLSFVTYVYIGASYYNLNNFDSANYFLQKAEIMASRFHDPDDEVRLYNTLGVMYYDNGNYQQGANYFSRALEIVNGKRPLDEFSAVSIQTHIATSYYHLGLFARSLSIYNKILHYGLFSDPIYLNMGMAYASLEKYEDALACFRKVNARKMPGVLNEMAYAQMQLHRPDSSARLLDQWWKQNSTGHANDLDKGTNDLYRAGLLAAQQQYLPALNSLQKAIILFSRNFNNEDIFSNPSNFTGTFASYRLYDALYQKALLFGNLYRSQPKEEYIVASYAAYQAAISILRYIEKNYETDDAKIFLKKKNAELYQGALSVCMELYRLHPGDRYLEQAFMISEKNKASVIMANLQQTQFQRTPETGEAGRGMGEAAGANGATTERGAAEGLLQKERNIKYNIARLNVKIEEATGSQQEAAMAREKSAYEIQLSQLQKEWEKNDRYYQAKYADTMPGVKELQQHLGDQQQLISFYVTPAAVHIFLLTRSSFAYTRVDSVSALQEEVGGWLEALKTTESGRKFKGYDIGARLYDRLIKPIQAAIPAREEWIVVPDGFLWFLPFESLPEEEGSDRAGGSAGGSNGAGGDGKTLLETTTISYRFSSRMLVVPPSRSNDGPPAGILSFAPFASHGGRFDGPDSVRFGSLPASGEEIANLAGRRYMDSSATRERFLQEIGQYPIIHLATHAVSSPSTASASFVAFYPRRGSLIDDCLFLEELYGLDMHSARMVVISACETGQGQLVNSEGVISLARAFAYAGCESTISSLWKADDRSTSLILQKFYQYLHKGYTRSKALQQAKLDYLAGDAVNKNPAYWSHLILIGNTEPLYKKKYPLKWGIVIICLGLVVGAVVFRIWKNGKKKSTLFL